MYLSGSSRDWKHITEQIGMFAFTGMTPEQVATCTRDYDCNGSLRISDELISKHWPGNKTIYSSSSLLAAGFNVV